MSPDVSPADTVSWRARDAALMVFAGLVGALVATLIVGENPDAIGIFGVIVPAQTGATLAAFGFLARSRPAWRSGLSWEWDKRDAIGLLIGAGLQIGLSIIAYWVVVELLGGDAPTQDVVEAASEAIGTPARVLVFLGVVLVGPAAEEIVFRGVLLGALRRHRSDASSILISSAAFAALHLLDPNAILAVPFLFVVGVVMGRAVVRTGRLGRAIAIHSGFNLVSVVALFAT